MHNDDRRGFNTLKAVVRRIKEFDPKGEKTQWRKCSEITNYACAREMASISINDRLVHLDLPVLVPDFTIRLRNVDAIGISVGKTPLTGVSRREDFKSGTFLKENNTILLAFTPVQNQISIEIQI